MCRSMQRILPGQLSSAVRRVRPFDNPIQSFRMFPGCSHTASAKFLKSLVGRTRARTWEPMIKRLPFSMLFQRLSFKLSYCALTKSMRYTPTVNRICDFRSRPTRRPPASRHEPPLPANGCTRARSLSNSLISRNSRSARSASASSKGRSCRHCSDHRKSQAGRSSASRHRTRNNLGLDRYTKGAGCGAPCAKPKLSGRKLEGCYSGADDSPAGSRSRASVAPAGYEPAQPARRPAAAIGRSTKTRSAT
jgi:hypothetical protein